MKKDKIKILFVRLSPSSFVQNDLKLLKKHFEVKDIDFILTWKDPKNTFKTILNMIKGIIWADLTFSWFADFHALWAVRLSKLFRKKSIVIVGGYEVANVPELNYGLMRENKSRSKVRYILNNADKICAVSKFTKNEIMKYSKSNNIEIVYNGIDYHKFKPLGKKGNVIVTLSNIEEKTYRLKGLDTFIEVSNYFPELKFVIIGNYDLKFCNKLDVPANVIFTGALSQEDIVSWFNKSKIYCQLSYRESFGMALAESMCCECIPIVTNSAALPEVVENTGFYAPYGNVNAISESIKKALDSDKGKSARKRIIKMFPLSNRERILKEIIKNLLYKDSKINT